MSIQNKPNMCATMAMHTYLTICLLKLLHTHKVFFLLLMSLPSLLASYIDSGEQLPSHAYKV